MTEVLINQTPVAFIKEFLMQEYHCWQVAYQQADSQVYQATLDAFREKYYAFDAVLSVFRPIQIDSDWLIEAKAFLSATSERPLFKIETYQAQNEKVYAAYVGSNDLGSDTYSEVIIFKIIQNTYKIISIFECLLEGGIDYFDGEDFAFNQATLIDVEKFRPPSDDIDLMDYKST